MNEKNHDFNPITAAFGFGIGGNSRAARSARAKLQRRDRKGRFAFQGGGFSFNIRFSDGVRKLSGRVVGASGTEDVEIEVKGNKGVPDGIYALPSSKGDSVAAILPEEALKDLPKVQTRVSERLAIDSNTLKRMEQPTGWTKQVTPDGEPEIWTSEDGYFVKKDGDTFTLHRADLSDNSIGREVARGESWADIQKAAVEDQDDYAKVLEQSARAQAPIQSPSQPSKEFESFLERFFPGGNAGEPPSGGPGGPVDGEPGDGDDDDDGEAFDREYDAGREELLEKVDYFVGGLLDDDEFNEYIGYVVDEGPFNVNEKREIQKAYDEYLDEAEKASAIEDSEDQNQAFNDAKSKLYDKLEGITDGSYPPKPPSGGPGGPVDGEPTGPYPFKEFRDFFEPGFEEVINTNALGDAGQYDGPWALEVVDKLDAEEDLTVDELAGLRELMRNERKNADSADPELRSQFEVDELDAKIAKLDEEINNQHLAAAQRIADEVVSELSGQPSGLDNETDPDEVIEAKLEQAAELGDIASTDEAYESVKEMVNNIINPPRATEAPITPQSAQRDLLEKPDFDEMDEEEKRIALEEWREDILEVADAQEDRLRAKLGDEEYNKQFGGAVPAIEEESKRFRQDDVDVWESSLEEAAKMADRLRNALPDEQEEEQEQKLSPQAIAESIVQQVTDEIAGNPSAFDNDIDIQELIDAKIEDAIRIGDIDASEADAVSNAIEQLTSTEQPIFAGKEFNIFDEMFEAPDGAYKPKIFELYKPKGRQDDNSLEYTDDPSVLATKFTLPELIMALRESVVPENANEASGFGSLDFGDGDELVPAEALYEAIDLAGADSRKVLAAIYDEELGPDAGTPNMDRYQTELNDDALLDQADLQPLDKTLLSDEEAIQLNRQLSLPSNAQVLLDEMNDYIETNPKIQELADFLRNFDEFDLYDEEAFPKTLNKYLPFAYSDDKEEQDTFKALWGVFMSLDGSSSKVNDESSYFRGPLMNEFRNMFGDSWREEYDSFIENFGGFREFVQGKNRIVNGEDDLDSGSVGANFLRLMKASSSENTVRLQRSFGVPMSNPILLDRYTTVGSIFALDPRPFSTNDFANEELFQSWVPSEKTSHRVVLVAEPGEMQSTSAVGISWFSGEQEHIGYGEFEVVSVERKPASRLRPGAVDDIIVTVKKADTGIEDIAAESPVLSPQAAQDVPLREIKDVSNWTRTGNQTGGSNVGAFYEDENGQGYYVKVPKSQSHAENETLASVFYDAMGAPSAEVSIGNDNGDIRVVSKLIPGATEDLGSRVRSGDEEYLNKLREHFIVDAWLANWDVTGTGFDNVMSDSDGNPVRVDPGGALMWRAQGAPKSALGQFTEETDFVPELDTLRDSDLNAYSASVFGSLTDEDLAAQAEQLRDNMSPERIDAIVDSIVTDPESAEFLKERLRNRRQGILDRFGLEDRQALTEPVSIEDSMGYPAQELQAGDVTVEDSFTIERVFRDEKTPKGKVSVEGYYPGHTAQRKEFDENFSVEAMRGGSTPPKGSRPPIIKPERPGFNPTSPSFSGSIAEELEAADSWAEIRDILADKEIVFFDYETTGLGPESLNRPVQLGAVKVRNGEVIDRFNVFIDPQEELSEWSKANLLNADGEPLTNEYLLQQLGMGEAHAMFIDWMGESTILGAHNMPFDREVLERILAEENLLLPFDGLGYIDTLGLGRDILNKRSKENPDGPQGHRLPQLLEHYGIELENWHTADADSDGTAKLFNAMLNDVAGRPDVDPSTRDFVSKQREYDKKKKAHDEQVEAYKDALAEYEAKKAVAAAWNCGGGLTAAATEDGNSDCNVPSVDDMIKNASVTPGELSDPDAVTSGNPVEPDSPYDDNVADTTEVEDLFPIQGEAYAPTAQQQVIINSVLSNEGADTVVRAAAGAGKTSTLVALAKRFQKYKPNKKIIYIAFNRSVADEARAKMPSNVEVRTADSISYNWTKINFPELIKKKGNPNRLVKPSDIVDHLGVPSFGQGDSKISPIKMVKELRQALYEFTISADREIGTQHFKGEGLSSEDVTPEILEAAQRWWADINDPKGKMPFDFNHMKKLWSLSDPDLSDPSSGLKSGANVVFVDEFQDTNDVLGSVLVNQPNTQNVYVGDENQAIYQFMGANDWLQKVVVDFDLPITQSFRFGPTIARQGNRFLRFKERFLGSKKTFSVEGAGKTEGELVLSGTMQDADAVLVRSNAGAFKEVREELMNGRTVGVTKGFKKDLDDFIAAVEWLQGDKATRGNRPARMPEDLRQFDTWQKVVDASKDEENDFSRKLNILIGDVEEMGLQELKDMTKQVKVVTGAGDKKDIESLPSLPDDLSVGTESADGIGKGVGFKVEKDGFILTGKTFDVKDQIKSANLGAKWDKARGGWFIPSGADDASRRQKLQSIQNAIFTSDEKQGGQVDVVVTTVHQAKGLEWPNVRIGKDFFGPRKRKGMEDALPGDPTAWIMPNESEIHLAYVAATRAMNKIDLGSLNWVDGWVPDDDPSGSLDVPEADVPEADVPEAADLQEANVPEAPDVVTEPAQSTGIKYPALGMAPSEEKIQADLQETFDEIEKVVKELTDPDSKVLTKASTKKGVKTAGEKLSNLRNRLNSGEITKEQALKELADIIDEIPSGVGEEIIEVDTLRDFASDIERILDGTFYQRPTGPDLPPIDSPYGYSKNGVFLVPGSRVRDKWGYAGTVDRYNKGGGWLNVYVARDIGTPEQPEGYQQSKGTKHLTTIPEDGDNRPWAYVAGMPLNKLPDNWRELATPGEIADIEAAMEKAASKGKKSSTKEIPPGGGDDGDGGGGGGGGGVSAPSSDGDGDDGGGGSPKAEAPEGAPEVPSTESQVVTNVEEGQVAVNDIDPDWQTILADSDENKTISDFEDYYAQQKFVLDKFINPDATDEDEEKAYGLRAYQYEGYSDINRFLRAEDPESDPDTEELIKSLDDLFDAAPTVPRDMVLYRGVHSEYANTLMDSYEVGDLFTDASYTSTSVRKDEANEWSKSFDDEFVPEYEGQTPPRLVLEIFVPEGTRGIHVPSYIGVEAYEDEQEVLLDRGTTYRVISKTVDPDGETRVMRVAVVNQSRQGSDKETATSKKEYEELEPTGDAADDLQSYYWINGIGYKSDMSQEELEKLEKIAEFTNSERADWLLAVAKEQGFDKWIDDNKYDSTVQQMIELRDAIENAPPINVDTTAYFVFDSGLGLKKVENLKNMKAFNPLRASGLMIGTLDRYYAEEKAKEIGNNAIILQLDLKRGDKALYLPAYLKQLDDLESEKRIAIPNGSLFEVSSNSLVSGDNIDDEFRFISAISTTKENIANKVSVIPEEQSSSIITETGRPKVKVENPLDISESSFDAVQSLTAAVKNTAKIKDENKKIQSAAVDSSDIEDLEIQTYTVVDSDTGERSVRLRFKLTSWAGKRQRAAINTNNYAAEEGDQDWVVNRGITIPMSSRDSDGNVVINKSKTLTSYDQDYAKTYTRVISTSNGNATITFLSGRYNEDLRSENNAHIPTAFHNLVTIDLPADASQQDIEKALKAAGIENVRAASPEDVIVLAENRLLSVFAGYSDPTINEKDQQVRSDKLRQIKKDWKVRPEDVKISTDSSGIITYSLPEETVEELISYSSVQALAHRLSWDGIRYFLQNKYPYATSQEIDDLYAKQVVDIITSELKSTVTRYTSGIVVEGMSSSSDIGTGGADYVFMTPSILNRISPVYGEEVQIMFDPAKILSRAEFYANQRDEFGRRAEAKMTDMLKNGVERGDRPEVMVKHGLSMDYADAVVAGPTIRKRILEELRNRGIFEINNTPIEEFIQETYYTSKNEKEQNAEVDKTAKDNLEKFLDLSNGTNYTADYSSEPGDDVTESFNKALGANIFSSKPTLPFSESNAQVVGYTKNGSLIIRDSGNGDVYRYDPFVDPDYTDQVQKLDALEIISITKDMISAKSDYEHETYSAFLHDRSEFAGIFWNTSAITDYPSGLSDASEVDNYRAYIGEYGNEGIAGVASRIILVAMLTEPSSVGFINEYLEKLEDLIDEYPDIVRQIKMTKSLGLKNLLM